MWNGAVGSSWKADRKTVKLNPHITKKYGVKRRSDSEVIDPIEDIRDQASPLSARRFRSF
jgi:hypothetical protein